MFFLVRSDAQWWLCQQKPSDKGPFEFLLSYTEIRWYKTRCGYSGKQENQGEFRTAYIIKCLSRYIYLMKTLSSYSVRDIDRQSFGFLSIGLVTETPVLRHGYDTAIVDTAPCNTVYMTFGTLHINRIYEASINGGGTSL